MSEYKYCQGPKCHEYKTKDRIRGSKGDKHYETRKRSSFYYLNGNACSTICQNDWFNKFGNMALDHFGRIHEPKRTDASGAWYKDHRYDRTSSGPYNSANYHHYFVNDLLGQRISITQEEYDDKNYTTPRRQVVVQVEATNSKGDIIQQDTLKI
jgi:hypothetical protein